MHTFLSALFAALFTFSHASTARQTPPPSDAHMQIASDRVPTRYELAQLRTSSVYAGNGCPACRRTNVTYRER